MSIEISKKVADYLVSMGAISFEDNNGLEHVILQGNDLVITYNVTHHQQEIINEETIVNPQ